jgi:hypothetical protein
MAQVYQPPKQSRMGQLIDAVVILVLVFLALYIPLKMELAGAAKGDWLPGEYTVAQDPDGAVMLTSDNGLVKKIAVDGTVTFENLTWEALEQNEVMQAQWGKLGYDLQTAAEAITKRYDYTVDWAWLILTMAAVGGYFLFLVRQSDREYRQIIAEKFGNRS